MFRTLFNNRFLQASTVVFIGSVAANFLNYAFNLVMGRLLPPEIYGELVALFTLLVIVSVPGGTITMVLSKYTADHMAKGETDAVSALRRATRVPMYYLGVGSFILTLILALPLSSYLHVPLVPMLIFSLLLPLSFFTASNNGFLQGLQAFKALSISNVINALLKFAFSIFFVLLGLSIGGIVCALIIASLLAFTYGWWVLRRRMPHTGTPSTETNWYTVFRDKRHYIGFTFLATLLLAIFVNVDTLLAKHYLEPFIAGEYAALSVLGKIITYGSAAVLVVLFPMTSASHTARDGKTGRLLAFSLAIVGLASVFLVVLFGTFPSYIISLLFGPEYLGGAPYLVYFAGAMGLSSMATVFTQYFLATHHKTFIYPLSILALAEIIGISIFHTSIIAIVLVSLSTSAILLMSCIVLYFLEKNIRYE